jgi:P pilus assembly chaperone PapD
MHLPAWIKRLLRSPAARARAAVALLLSIVAPMAAHAMSVTPVVVEMTSAGTGSRATLQVINNGAAPLPVEIEISRVELGTNGEQTLKRADGDFRIFPAQAMVPPGATQVFRLQWAGEPNLNASQSYIASVNQLPVKLAKPVSGVNIVFNFATIVNVAPVKGERHLSLVSTGVGRDKSGRNRPALTISNPGNIHARLSDATVTLQRGSWTRTLKPDEIRQVVGVGLVQPGKQRRFVIPVDLPPGGGQIAARIEYAKAGP